MFFGKITRAKKRRIADDGVALRPRIEQRILAPDVFVEVVQWQVALEFQGVGVMFRQGVGVFLPELLRLPGGEAAGEHERDLGGFHGVFIDVQAVKLFGRNARGGADDGNLRAIFGEQAQQDFFLQLAQRAEGHEEKVAAAAGGIKHAEIAEFGQQFAELRGGFGGGDAFFPRADDGGPDDFLDVGLVGEMRAQRVALLRAEAGFKERAEDDGLDPAPILQRSRLCRRQTHLSLQTSIRLLLI